MTPEPGLLYIGLYPTDSFSSWFYSYPLAFSVEVQTVLPFYYISTRRNQICPYPRTCDSNTYVLILRCLSSLPVILLINRLIFRQNSCNLTSAHRMTARQDILFVIQPLSYDMRKTIFPRSCLSLNTNPAFLCVFLIRIVASL